MTAPQPVHEIKRYRRTHSWDYARGASLFITISTAGAIARRLRPFGRIRDGQAVPHAGGGLALYWQVDGPHRLRPNTQAGAGA